MQLLLRKPRGVELTIEGKSFLHYARNVVTAANALESNFSGQGGAGRSRLFIASQQLDFVHPLIRPICKIRTAACIITSWRPTATM